MAFAAEPPHPQQAAGQDRLIPGRERPGGREQPGLAKRPVDVE